MSCSKCPSTQVAICTRFSCLRPLCFEGLLKTVLGQRRAAEGYSWEPVKVLTKVIDRQQFRDSRANGRDSEDSRIPADPHKALGCTWVRCVSAIDTGSYTVEGRWAAGLQGARHMLVHDARVISVL